MIQTGKEINKTDQINKFIDVVQKTIQDSIQWHTGSATPGSFPKAVLDTNIVEKPTDESLVDPIITAEPLAVLLRDYAKKYCKYRKINYRRYYNSGGYSVNINQTKIAAISTILPPAGDYRFYNFPSTRVSSEDKDFDALSGLNDVEVDFEINAENFNKFINALKAEWVEASNNIADLRYYYCHTSCHSSHSSHSSGRMRR